MEQAVDNESDCPPITSTCCTSSSSQLVLLYKFTTSASCFGRHLRYSYSIEIIRPNTCILLLLLSYLGPSSSVKHSTPSPSQPTCRFFSTITDSSKPPSSSTPGPITDSPTFPSPRPLPKSLRQKCHQRPNPPNRASSGNTSSPTTPSTSSSGRRSQSARSAS